MKTLLTSVFAILGLLAVLSSGSAHETDGTASIMPGGCVKNSPPKESVSVDIQGTIRQALGFLVDGSLWEITVNGRTYLVDLGNDKTRQLKDGMTVRVTGQPVSKVLFPLVRTMEYPPRFRPEIHRWIVVADTVEPISEKNPRTFAKVTVRGMLNLNGRLGYPSQSFKLVTANGQTVILDLGIITGVGMLKVEALNGQLVELEGDLAGFHYVTTMCVPDRHEVPIVRLQKITPVKSGGRE
jgi:hypothetical protein